MMRANRYTLAKLCLLTALAVPMQRTVSATVSLATPQTDNSDVILLAQADTPQFTLPDSLEGEEAIAIDGSSSMRSMTTALGEQFQERYPDAAVDSTFNGSDIAIERLSAGEVDLAAIGRPLTEDESTAGLTAVPIAREKIAIIIGPDNSFDGDITFEQFGQIFRGEITDWSELGGEPGPIRFVDRPELSDTRQAFRQYPVFQEAPFETGATAETVGADETDEVIEALGDDGIGYAIANQVMGNSAAKIIPMHKTLPDNPAYPFSQPRSFVYAGEANTVVQGFLGVATSEEGESVVQDVQSAEGAAAVEIEGPRPTAESADGTLTARTDEDNIAVIEDADGNLIGAPLLGAGGAVTALAFSPDGSTLATGSNTGKVRYWSTEDAEPLGDAFQPVTGANSAITDLEFDTNDKLVVGASSGRGSWGLNGLPFGESAGATAGTAAAAEPAGLSPWLWLIPILGLLGAGLWFLLGKRRTSTPTEAPRQTSPTATVPPPVTDPETAREVSNRAQSVISTDRGTERGTGEVRTTVAEGAAIASDATSDTSTLPLPVSVPGLDTTADADSTATPLPIYESTDLESPSDLEGTNLDLVTPLAAAGGAAAVGGMVFAGLDSGVETDDDEEGDVWDDNLDLTLDDAPSDASDAPEADALLTSDPSRSDDSPADIESSKVAPADIDSIEPTRNTVIAETETILDIEPTRETIIGDSAVIFGEAAATDNAAKADFQSATVIQGSDAGADIKSPGSVPDLPVAVVSPAVDSPEPVADDSINSLVDADPSPETPAAEVPTAEVLSAEAVSAETDAFFSTSVVGTVAAGVAAGAATSISSSSPDPIVGDPDPLTIEELASVDDGLSELPEGYGDSRIVLLPRDPQWAYTYWDVSNEHKEELRQQGGTRLVLRLYDVTDIDLASQSPHSMQQQDCHEMASTWYLEVPVSDRDYVAELGYLTDDDRWLMLARSAPVRVPPIYPSDWVKDQFVTIDWDEDLAGRTFGDLGQPYSPDKAEDAAATDLPKIYDDLFGFTQSQDALRVAGSLFGSMHQEAPGGPGALSPSGSGAGMAINMSGLNVSGLNMSGVGPALGRVRNFWLVADAELIVYGATEPDATLTVGDRIVPLNPDGTFRFHVSFPDGEIDYPIRAVAADGEQSRSIHMHFERETPERNTNTKAEAKDEWF